MVLSKLKWGDFFLLKQKGLRYKSRCFILLYKLADEGGMGFIVSKKHGNAVQRNRLKRQVRCLFEFYYKSCDARWLVNLKLLVIPIPNRTTFAQKQADLCSALNHVYKLILKE